MRKTTALILTLIMLFTVFAQAEETAYENMISMYRQALHDCWGYDELAARGLDEDLHEYFLRQDARPVWCVIQLNGEPVLLMGDAGDEPGQFRELFSVAGGTVRRAVKGWERNRWYARTDGFLYNEGANSAFESIYQFGRWENGALTDLKTIDYCGDENASAWTLTENGVSRSLTETEAWSLIDAWRERIAPLPWTPLSDTRKGVIAAEKGRTALRSTPDARGERLGDLHTGDVVLVDETAGAYAWVRFHRDDGTVWGYTAVADIRFPEQSEAVAFGQLSKNGKTQGNVRINIRAKNSKNSAVIAQWPIGTYVDVYAVLDGWYEIEWNGTQGYVMSDFLTVFGGP